MLYALTLFAFGAAVQSMCASKACDEAPEDDASGLFLLQNQIAINKHAIDADMLHAMKSIKSELKMQRDNFETMVAEHMHTFQTAVAEHKMHVDTLERRLAALEAVSPQPKEHRDTQIPTTNPTIGEISNHTLHDDNISLVEDLVDKSDFGRSESNTEWSVGPSDSIDKCNYGYRTGMMAQEGRTTAVGFQAGFSTQGYRATALGSAAGYNRQVMEATAVGSDAGSEDQGRRAVAVGHAAGQFTQNTNAVAVGGLAGLRTQGQEAIAVGSLAGFEYQASKAVAIGVKAGQSNQGERAIAIGPNTAQDDQAAGGIHISTCKGIPGAPDCGVAVSEPHHIRIETKTAKLSFTNGKWEASPKLDSNAITFPPAQAPSSHTYIEDQTTGYCSPWGSSGGDLCKEDTNGSNACSGAASNGYLPNCDYDCAVQRCNLDSECKGFTKNQDGLFKLKSKIRSVAANGDYQCFRKL